MCRMDLSMNEMFRNGLKHGMEWNVNLTWNVNLVSRILTLECAFVTMAT